MYASKNCKSSKFNRRRKALTKGTEMERGRPWSPGFYYQRQKEEYKVKSKGTMKLFADTFSRVVTLPSNLRRVSNDKEIAPDKQKFCS